jgi:pimeloyl-ACP methyl ester carboxylesterase
MSQQISLYRHAHMVSVSLNQGPIALCVSRVPVRADSLSKRGRLLLLHGNPASMHDFGRLAALLCDEFELAAIDLPGFGRSANVRAVPGESLLDTYARHITAAMEQIGWHDSFYVLGHSHGGAVAQSIAASFPERVAGLVLLASVGTPAHWGYRQLIVPGVPAGLRLLASSVKRGLPRPVKRRIVRGVMTPVFAPFPLPDSWVDEQLAFVESRPEILVNMALVASGDPCGQLARAIARIRAPALFVHGSADRLVPAAHSRALYDTLSRSHRAEFHELPDTGHMLHLSHPERIRDLLLAWHR